MSTGRRRKGPDWERFTYTRLVVARSSTAYKAGGQSPPFFFSLAGGQCQSSSSSLGVSGVVWCGVAGFAWATVSCGCHVPSVTKSLSLRILFLHRRLNSTFNAAVGDSHEK